MENNLSIVKDKFKELPNNVEAEQAVIGSILVTNEIFDEISTIISGNNFFDPMHQKIFNAIEKLIYKGMLANPITLKNYFEDSLQLVDKKLNVKSNLGSNILINGFYKNQNDLDFDFELSNLFIQNFFEINKNPISGNIESAINLV